MKCLEEGSSDGGSARLQVESKKTGGREGGEMRDRREKEVRVKKERDGAVVLCVPAPFS